MTAAIMLQGAGSNVGKSLIVAGLCRAFADRGLAVRPFKPQNMSNNAGVTADGGEIGRAQMLQARAARVPPSVHMNPVLLKPETETGAQVILRGQRFATMRARDYGSRKAELLPAVLDSFGRLTGEADLVICEGAGSPAETNLRAGDIANMGFALSAGVPVAIVGDIDRGGVIASLVGTHAVLDAADRALVRGFIVNKFRGDPSLFDDGVRVIEDLTGWRSLGVVPHLAEAARLPEEDVLGLTGAPKPNARIRIAVPRLPRIANFDDLDPLRQEPDVDLTVVEPGRPIPGDCDLVLIPGSKATIADLEAIRREGWDIDIRAHHRRGGAVLGLCGGFQMLGRRIADPDGVEGSAGEVEGLCLLDVTTVLTSDKTTAAATGLHLPTGAALSGYEIHLGRSRGPDCGRPFAMLDGERGQGMPDGAIAPDGLVAGTYLHGLFAGDVFRAAFLTGLGGRASIAFETGVEMALDALAAHLAASLDLDAILAIAQERTRS